MFKNIKCFYKIILYRILVFVVIVVLVLKDNFIIDFLMFFNSNFKFNYLFSIGFGKFCFLLLVKFCGFKEMVCNFIF